jgi:hypothetical protein
LNSCIDSLCCTGTRHLIRKLKHYMLVGLGEFVDFDVESSVVGQYLVLLECQFVAVCLLLFQ